jgi:hypothetical protein
MTALTQVREPASFLKPGSRSRELTAEAVKVPRDGITSEAAPSGHIDSPHTPTYDSQS